ncbi:hypothetical protein SAMN05216464_10394 [Mucilaginibacter pineti]|uniref:DUF5723 domain-containing protein n=1 Tax=Mucilaginibacter pineti TaxID=1391627 RepID=A0A1G6YTX9_9SPHI|nr:DUF5723 family protein [Mucilaginibacter pineti]SDD93780.1 hypothetical protein SAMN05216464_10394 [Mucilaginibacter pineti]
MNKILIVFCFILFSLSVSAQQFSQYNTGTLYDSFENPSQRSFIPDSSREYAFNFLFPAFNVNSYITGHVQQSLKSRFFQKPATYNSGNLTIGRGNYNHVNANANAYAIMFKMFTSLNGDVEIGFSAQTRAEVRGLLSDESIAILDNNPALFPKDEYSNIFNDHYQYQAYNQFGFSYRERINKKFAIGFKASLLLGVQYQKFDITQSHITFDKPTETAVLALQGRYYDSYIPGPSTARDFLPTFRSPGASVSFGTSYITDDRITLQANVKDLGFIHWSKRSAISDFNSSEVLKDLNLPSREDTIYNRTYKILNSNRVTQSFTTKTNARAELSATKSYWIDDDNQYKYSPTIIASKELFYTGFTGALVNNFQHNNLMIGLTTTYDDMKLFNLGGQFMIKSPNAEFYIGSERLLNTGRLALASAGNQTQIDHRSNYTGGDIYMGFTLKFGYVVEHPMNASVIPMGEKGFFGRLFGRLFKTDR